MKTIRVRKGKEKRFLIAVIFDCPNANKDPKDKKTFPSEYIKYLLRWSFKRFLKK